MTATTTLGSPIGRRPDLRDPDLLEVLLVRVEGVGRAAVRGPGGGLDDRVRDDEEHPRVRAKGRADLARLTRLRDDDAALPERGGFRPLDAGDRDATRGRIRARRR